MLFNDHLCQDWKQQFKNNSFSFKKKKNMAASTERIRSWCKYKVFQHKGPKNNKLYDLDERIILYYEKYDLC